MKRMAIVFFALIIVLLLSTNIFSYPFQQIASTNFSIEQFKIPTIQDKIEIITTIVQNDPLTARLFLSLFFMFMLLTWGLQELKRQKY